MKTLRTLALSYPEAEESVACKGTLLECATFKARGKAFLFLGKSAIRLKLRDSLEEAAKSGACKVGANGWTAITLNHDQTPPAAVLARWIDESYRLLAPKTALSRVKLTKKKTRAR